MHGASSPRPYGLPLPISLALPVGDSTPPSSPPSPSLPYALRAAAAVPLASPRERRPHLPKAGEAGHWEGLRGDGLWYSTHPEVQAVTGGQPLTFARCMPIFDPWCEAAVDLDNLLGDHHSDFNRADVWLSGALRRGGPSWAAAVLLQPQPRPARLRAALARLSRHLVSSAERQSGAAARGPGRPQRLQILQDSMMDLFGGFWLSLWLRLARYAVPAPAPAALGCRYRQLGRRTWHHCSGGVRLQLVPQGLHNNVPHTGGAELLRHARFAPVPSGRPALSVVGPTAAGTP